MERVAILASFFEDIEVEFQRPLSDGLRSRRGVSDCSVYVRLPTDLEFARGVPLPGYPVYEVYSCCVECPPLVACHVDCRCDLYRLSRTNLARVVW